MKGLAQPQSSRPTTTEEQRAPNAAGAARERRDLFISYSRANLEFVRRLHVRLVESGKKVYVDFRDIPTWSDDWQTELFGEIEAADTFVLVLSTDSLASEHVNVEVDHAVEQGKRLKPLQLEDVDDERVPAALRKPQWVDFRDSERFEENFARFLEVLNTDVDWVQRHTRVLLDANDWRARGHDKSLLMGRSDLRDAEEWFARQAGKDPPATDLQVEFILASRKAAAKRRQIVFGSVLSALAVAIALAVFALVQRSQAISNEKSARSRELAARATAALTDDPAASVQLAAQGVRVRPTAEAVDALRASLAESHLRVVLRGHSKYLVNATFSPDSTRVVTASADGTARIWDASSGDELARMSGHEGVVTDAVFSPDGKLVATASGGAGWARVWDAGTGTLTKTIGTRRGALTRAVFSPDGKLLLTAGAGTPHVWDLASGRRVAALRGRASVVFDAAFSADGKLVFTSGDLAVRVWDTRSGRPRAVLARRLTIPGAAAFSPDGKLIVTAGLDHTARISRTSNGDDVAVLRGHNDDVTAVAVSPDGKLVASGSGDGTARIWGLRSGKQVAVLQHHTEGLTQVLFSPDGALLLTASEDGTAREWEVGSWQEVAVLRGGQTGAVGGGVFSPNGRLVVTPVGRTARVWETASAVSVAHLSGVTGSHPVVSADGRLVATTGIGNTVRIRSATTGQPLAVLRSRGGLRAVALSPHGGRVLTVSDKTIRIWNAETGQLPVVLTRTDGRATIASFSTDGKLVLVAGADGTVGVWKAATGEPTALLRASSDNVETASLSPDGRIALTTSPVGAVTLWDVENAKKIVLPGHYAEIFGASFSPDGKRIVTTHEDWTIRVWDTSSRRQVAVLHGPIGVIGVALSPDGKTVLVNYGSEVRLWDVETAKTFAILATNGYHGLTSADFSPDGALVLTATNGASPRLWKATNGQQFAIVPGYPDGAVVASFSPDGRRMIVEGYNDNSTRVYVCRACGPVADLLHLADSSPRAS